MTPLSVPLLVLSSLLGSTGAPGSSMTTAITPPFSPAAIALDIRRLHSGGRVLYVAAHPDDENTRLISYLTHRRHLRVGYLSLTRGEGGQNRIGLEQGELLGVVRTQELMGARSIDLGEQYFTRATDFGYSKSAEESLEVWGHQQVLADVVEVVRRFRPHVIVTRFPPQGGTHGHHLASARLAAEAFVAAADPKRFPEQVAQLGTWQALRVVYNQIPRWIDPASETGVPLDVAGYVPALGVSLGEVSAASRSMHRSQGFGVMAQYGPVPEYFATVAGEPFDKDPFSGLDERQDPQVRSALSAALGALETQGAPAALPHLARAYRAAGALEHRPTREATQRQIAELMVRAAGLRLDARAPRAELVAGETVQIDLHVDPRLRSELRAVEATLPGEGGVVGVSPPGVAFAVQSVPLRVPANARPASPPWLQSPPQVREAWDPVPLVVTYTLRLQDLTFTVERPLRYVWDEPVAGERSTWVQVAPPVAVTPESPVTMIPNGGPVAAYVEVVNHAPGFRGTLSLEVPEGWVVRPESIPLVMGERGDVQRHGFEITAPPGSPPSVTAAFRLTPGDGAVWQRASYDYPHLPPTTVFRPSAITLVPVELDTSQVGTVGYVSGSGDRVGELLAQVGLSVEEVTEDTLARGDLGRFGAILFGVRAFNVLPELARYHDRLMAYVAQGGTVVMQYNTNNRIDPLRAPLGPYPFEIGRTRVTDQNAPMRWTDHPVLHRPHALGPKDFEGWVQERGLYFAQTWDPRYHTPLSMNDRGEEGAAGALLIAKHQRGTFVYTGLSLFRQLPAGVPGAYRLLVNLLAHGGDP